MDARALLAFLLALHVALAVAVSSAADIEEIVYAIYLQSLLLIFLALAGVALLFGQIAWKRMDRPARLIFRVCRANKARYGEGAVFLVVLAAMMQTYMVLKVSFPKMIPFYADPMIADIDTLLFRQDPWRITHAFFGPSVTRFLDFFYTTPCLMVAFAMTIWVSFSKDRAFSRKSVLAITMCWLLGGFWIAAALSSAGPIYMAHFYGDSRFSELTSVLPQDLTATQTQAYLLENFGIAGFGKGISAMPSMHNATSFLLIWMIYDRFGNGWQLWSANVFGGIVFVASVHLGWHYALDGILSALIVTLIWLAVNNIHVISSPFRNWAPIKLHPARPA